MFSIIAIDDMNDWTTLFDKDNPIKTPNLDRLAKMGTLFIYENVTAQQESSPGSHKKMVQSYQANSIRSGCPRRKCPGKSMNRRTGSIVALNGTMFQGMKNRAWRERSMLRNQSIAVLLLAWLNVE